jgi:hypothetical protein
MVSRRLLIVGAAAAWATPALAESTAFEVGQVWTLKPPMEPTARIRVGRVEANGAIIHISLWDTRPEIPNPTGALRRPLVASHLPISSEALARSVDHLVRESPPTHLDLEPGYRHWREANAGAFTITVAEIVDVILQTAPRGEVVRE